MVLKNSLRFYHNLFFVKDKGIVFITISSLNRYLNHQRAKSTIYSNTFRPVIRIGSNNRNGYAHNNYYTYSKNYQYLFYVLLNIKGIFDEVESCKKS
jgi:hypothetical protein